MPPGGGVLNQRGIIAHGNPNPTGSCMVRGYRRVSRVDGRSQA